MTAAHRSALDAIGADLDALIAEGKPVRRDFDDGGRLHIDRPLPFLCLHVGPKRDAAAEIASANASYLLADRAFAQVAVGLIGGRLAAHCGAFLLLEYGELAKDRFLIDDAPVLPPFEIALATGGGAAEQAARKRFAEAATKREAKYRTPRLNDYRLKPADLALPGIARLIVRFAPIYRSPAGQVFPALRRRIVANMVDSGLQAVSAFLKASKLEAPASHRALGRRALVEAVTRADRGLDAVASSFDFLLAVTPINAEAAWNEFEADGFSHAPRFLYRPLDIDVSAEKRKLYSVSLDSLEDPLLADLLLEKQQELDLQLSLLAARETPRFRELGRALYGGVEPSLLAAARGVLTEIGEVDAGAGASLRADAVAAAARDMIAGYRAAQSDFDACVEVRADVPPGMMVTANRLLVSRDTRVSPARLPALLSHEVGVHLLTYFNGRSQRLTILRSGLAGYEGTQEGLAVFAEYLVGGLTVARLRQLAARVVACDAMLRGAAFEQAFRLMLDECGLDRRSAFQVAMRTYRSGGLAKDAIYLRGVMQVLDHLANGGSLTPFWTGKIAAAHFGAIEELRARGLLHAPRLEPAFLASRQARPRLKRAMAGMRPIDMITP